jgi:hypothetical protein
MSTWRSSPLCPLVASSILTPFERLERSDLPGSADRGQRG